MHLNVFSQARLSGIETSKFQMAHALSGSFATTSAATVVLLRLTRGSCDSNLAGNSAQSYGMAHIAHCRRSAVKTFSSTCAGRNFVQVFLF